MKKTFSVIVMLCLILIACGQRNDTSKKWVNDFENVLTENQIQVLDSIIRDFEARTTNEIVLVTVKDIGNSPKMVDYAVELGNRWGVGKKDQENGLIILFSRTMREAFLATGYGTEKILKDEICKAIIDSTMVPFFKEEDYFGGLKAGLLECIKRWEK
jgi:uncharacterized protein